MLSNIRCRECDHLLKITEFGLNRICPYCGKNTATQKIQEVHVNFSGTIYAFPNDIPREKQEELYADVDYYNLCLHMNLINGDISNPPQSNANFYAHTGYSCWKAVDRLVKTTQEKLMQVGDDIPVFLWLSEQDGNGYLNLLFFSHLFKRFKKVYLVLCCSKKELENPLYEPKDSFHRKKALSPDELERMSEEFVQIQQMGGKYRAGQYGEIKLYSEEKLKDLVLSKVSKRYRTIGKIYMDVSTCFEKETGYILSFDTVNEIMLSLMIEKKVKSHTPYMLWGDNIVHDLLFCISFCRCDPATVNYSGDEFHIMREAVKDGYTLPLYDILSDDAVLDFEDGTVVIKGKQAIIEAIENYGEERSHPNGSAISCDIVRVTEGERYGVGEKCLVIFYHDREYNTSSRKIQDAKYHIAYIVKIQCKEGKIEAIKGLIPKGVDLEVLDE